MMTKFMCEDGTYKWHKLCSFKVLDFKKFGLHLVATDSFGVYVSERPVTINDLEFIVNELVDEGSVDLIDYGIFMCFKSRVTSRGIKQRMKKLGEI